MGEAEDLTRLRELGSTLQSIVGGLPGHVRRITVRAGELSVDVIWNTGEHAGGAVARPPDREAIPEAPSPDGARAVTAPMVGTFYGRPSPDEPLFVDTGDIVEVGNQVALIEAMKLFTPVLAEFRGRVAAMHVSDGEMVEFDQPLLDLVPVDE